jgi:predicted phosphohydrolase
MSLTIALTADLHWGHNPRGDDSTRLLADFLHRHPPDVLVLAGDIGTRHHFGHCLDLFADLGGHKALVPGNHDVWVETEAAHDSLHLYDVELPWACGERGFHYLDHGPLVLAPDLALVGSMNWYDYSWGRELLHQRFPTEEHRLRSKELTYGRHMDGVFVRGHGGDEAFTARLAADLARHLDEALAKAEKAVVVTHHPPFRAIAFPSTAQPEKLDEVLWAALTGNSRVEELLSRHAERIPFAFCGHTHRRRQGCLGPVRGYNIGGDYRFKRLLWLDWRAGTVEAHRFGES